jgi:hypothetical protein
VFNPRQIDECVDSIGRLPCDQAWLTGYTEAELVDVIAGVIAETTYTHYLVCSDDGVIPEFALEAVLETLADGHPVVTGYSNLDVIDMRVNLTKRPFELLTRSVAEDYDLYHLSEVLGWPDRLVPTCFAGFAVTGMSRDMWLKFPYRSDGVPSDWNLSRRLQDAKVPIVAPKAAFMWHVKEIVNLPDKEHRKRLLIGEVEPGVNWRTVVPA